MEPSKDLEIERQKLLKEIISGSNGIQTHLGYVVGYLYGQTPFMEMIRHAKSLFSTNEDLRDETPNELVRKITKNDIPLVKTYFSAIDDYIAGQSFDLVHEAAKALCFSKPIPESARIPDTEFYRKLALVRQLV